MKPKLSKKQLNYLDELFEGDLSEQQLLEKHKIARRQFNKWQSEPAFIAEFERRIESLSRQTLFLIARYSSLAAAKLVTLTESANHETCRKACLDIISLTGTISPKNPDGTNPAEQTRSDLSISPELAEKLLATIAKG